MRVFVLALLGVVFLSAPAFAISQKRGEAKVVKLFSGQVTKSERKSGRFEYSLRREDGILIDVVLDVRTGDILDAYLQIEEEDEEEIDGCEEDDDDQEGDDDDDEEDDD